MPSCHTLEREYLSDEVSHDEAVCCSHSGFIARCEDVYCRPRTADGATTLYGSVHDKLVEIEGLTVDLLRHSSHFNLASDMVDDVSSETLNLRHGGAEETSEKMGCNQN